MYTLHEEIDPRSWKITKYSIRNEQGELFPCHSACYSFDNCINDLTFTIAYNNYENLINQLDPEIIVMVHNMARHLLEVYSIPSYAYVNDDLEYHVSMILSYAHILQVIESIAQKACQTYKTLNKVFPQGN